MMLIISTRNTRSTYSRTGGDILNSTMKNLMFWMVAALVIFLFWSVSSRIQKNERQLSFSDFMAQLERGHVAKVTITGTGAGSQIVGRVQERPVDPDLRAAAGGEPRQRDAREGRGGARARREQLVVARAHHQLDTRSSS